MLRKLTALMVFMAAGSLVMANVDLRTNIRDIFVNGTCEEAGSITMSVNGDDFKNASSTQPIFIRIRLTKGVTLCDTLVDISRAATANTPARFHVPIYLAMRVETNSTNFTINPAASMSRAVSIIRWIEGEDFIWLRVQQPSDSWLSVAGNLIAPNDTARVAWTFGVTARVSRDENFNEWANNQANLPMNTRRPDGWVRGVDTTATVAPFATSTLICVNAEGSELGTTDQGDLNLLVFDSISLRYDTGDNYGGLRTALAPDTNFNQLTTNFSGDDSIARGRSRNCTYRITSKLGGGNYPLCFDEATINQQGDTVRGLLWTNSRAITFSVLGTDCLWARGASVTLTTPNGADYGFEVALDSNGDALEIANGVFLLVDGHFGLSVDGAARAFTAITLEGATFSAVGNANQLSSLAIITDNTPLTDRDNLEIGNNPSVQLSASLHIDPLSDPQPMTVEGTIYLTNRGTNLDSAPFNGGAQFTYTDEVTGASRTFDVTGNDQQAFCPPSMFRLEPPFEWPFGAWVECASSARIFYPYLPILNGNPNFWTGIVIVNQGLTNFDTLTGFVYEADGSAWTVDFGTLARREMQTWLVQEVEGEPLAFRQLRGQEVVATATPQAAGNDLVPFDLRSSMFVLGTTVGTTNQSVFGPDLDGFCLIGDLRFGDIYGYSPRTVEDIFIGRPLQNGNLPPSFVKKGQYSFTQEQIDGIMNKLFNR